MKKKNRKLSVVSGRAPSDDRTIHSGTISTLFDEPNVWSDWQVDLYIGQLSWVRMAALLVRNVSPEDVINALAPSLAAMRDKMETEILRCSANPLEGARYSVNLPGYRALFEDEARKAFEAFMDRLEGDADVSWLHQHVQRDGVWEQTFLWFFLNGIAHASVYDQLDLEKVNEDARWLADIDFYEPARMAADQFLVWHFYGELSERHDFVAPQPDEFSDHSTQNAPFSDWQDDWLTRRRALDERWERELNRAHTPVKGDVDLPADACLQAKRSNSWDRSLDIARVPPFDWRRQVVMQLRDVPLGEVVVAIDAALVKMAEDTAHKVVEQAHERGRQSAEIRFGEWFTWWRENFRHWTDPLRTGLNDFCTPDDAAYVGDWLSRFEPAVFADFLIRCAHGHLIERALGFRQKNQPKLATTLFKIDAYQPNLTMGLEGMTQHLWRRFADEHKICTDNSELWCNFEVDWNVPVAQP